MSSLTTLSPVRSEEPIFPLSVEPDLAVVRGGIRDLPDRHPGPADVPIVIEVADATLRRDRGMKLRACARAGIAVYWIVNLAGRSVEVYTDPNPAKLSYGKPRVYRNGGKIPVELNGKKVGAIPVADTFRESPWRKIESQIPVRAVRGSVSACLPRRRPPALDARAGQ